MQSVELVVAEGHPHNDGKVLSFVDPALPYMNARLQLVAGWGPPWGLRRHVARFEKVPFENFIQAA